MQLLYVSSTGNTIESKQNHFQTVITVTNDFIERIKPMTGM
jgi:predicted KAP-like P-loop ATPase